MNITGNALARLALLVTTFLLMGSAVHAQDMERPDMPKDLSVKQNNGVVTVMWTQVEDATLYYLIATAATGPDGSDVKRDLWARATNTTSNSIDLPDDLVHPGVTIRLLLVAYAPPFPSPHGPPAEADFVPVKDESSGKDLSDTVAGIAA